MCGRCRAARQHEGFQRIEFAVQGVDLPLQPLRLRLDDPQRLVAQLLSGVGCCKVRAEIEEIVLDADEHDVEFV
ncbi:hypothetical protein D3C71_1856960 [compost metagenome]